MWSLADKMTHPVLLILRLTLALLSCCSTLAGSDLPPNLACLTKNAQGLKGSYIEKLLKNNSDFQRPPNDDGNATEVIIDMFINSFDSVNVDTMDFQLTINLGQTWVDPRLKFDHIFPTVKKLTIPSRVKRMFWVPDTYFPNEKKAAYHDITLPNKVLRIYPNGTVSYTVRLSLKLSCHMNLQKFPLDNQRCEMRLESYGYTEEELRFIWRKDVQSIQVNPDLELPQFDLNMWSNDTCTGTYITGKYSCLNVTFYLERQYGYYIMQNYVPSMLIVILSWVSFWININAVPARISLGVSSVLTMTTQSLGVWMSMPRVTYVKAVDIWMTTCVIFVFFAMLEFAIVNTLSRKEIRTLSMKLRKESNNQAEESINKMVEGYAYGTSTMYDPNSRQLARKLDKISRRLFPVAFFIFNAVYWTLCLLPPF